MWNLCRFLLVFFCVGVLCGLAGLVALFAPLSLWLVGGTVAWAMFKRGKKYVFDSHGTARWATEEDTRGLRRGITVGTLPLGKKPNFLTMLKRLVSLPAKDACLGFLEVFPGHRPPLVKIDPVHAVVFAPTGAGKGVSIVIPTLLGCPESAVVIDIKGELFRETGARRQKLGHKIVCLDPFKKVTDSPDALNPLDFVDQESPLSIDECRDIAEAIVMRTGEEKDPHWNDSAEIMIGSICAAVVNFGKPGDRSLQTVRAVLADPAKFVSATKMLMDSPKWDGILQRLGSQLTFYEDKELGSVLTSCNRHLRFFDSPAVAACTSKSTFNPAELKTGTMTIYIVVPPEHLRALSGLVRLWIASLLRACVRN